jgi:hypothetical protein
MKIVIENVKFDFDLGCKLLKLKHETSPFPELNDFWNDIVPMTFKEIAKLENLEHRRIGMVCLGLERMIKEVKPILVSTQSLNKTTTWINQKGELETKKFNDVYRLYKVSGDYFNEGTQRYQQMTDSYFVKCNDTSTDREYYIWVDPSSVNRTNNSKVYSFSYKPDEITALQAIAWTIQTDVPQGNIEKIIRQGDCILIKTKGIFAKMDAPRHLTEQEYKTLLVAES